MLKAVHNSLVSLIYPQECTVCSLQVERHDDGVACRTCWASTSFFTGAEMLCGKCGAYLGDKAAPMPVFCRQCDDHSYDRAVAAGVYEKALAASIIRLKTAPVLPKVLIALIQTALQRCDLENTDVIVPIPLSKQRQHERGYNQADIIAAAISRLTALRFDAASLRRKLNTSMHRVGMDKKAREMTVRNAFEVVRPKLIEGKNILLVDDVFTSGATASACAKVLKKSGAVSVNIFTLARAVMH